MQRRLHGVAMVPSCCQHGAATLQVADHRGAGLIPEGLQPAHAFKKPYAAFRPEVVSSGVPCGKVGGSQTPVAQAVAVAHAMRASASAARAAAAAAGGWDIAADGGTGGTKMLDCTGDASSFGSPTLTGSWATVVALAAAAEKAAATAAAATVRNYTDAHCVLEATSSFSEGVAPSTASTMTPMDSSSSGVAFSKMQPAKAQGLGRDTGSSVSSTAVLPLRHKRKVVEIPLSASGSMIEVGQRFLFVRPRGSKYPMGCLDRAVVEVLEVSNFKTPPVQVRWGSGFTYWVQPLDLRLVPPSRSSSAKKGGPPRLRSAARAAVKAAESVAVLTAGECELTPSEFCSSASEAANVYAAFDAETPTASSQSSVVGNFQAHPVAHERRLGGHRDPEGNEISNSPNTLLPAPLVGGPSVAGRTPGLIEQQPVSEPLLTQPAASQSSEQQSNQAQALSVPVRTQNVHSDSIAVVRLHSGVATPITQAQGNVRLLYSHQAEVPLTAVSPRTCGNPVLAGWVASADPEMRRGTVTPQRWEAAATLTEPAVSQVAAHNPEIRVRSRSPWQSSSGVLKLQSPLSARQNGGIASGFNTPSRPPGLVVAPVSAERTASNRDETESRPIGKACCTAPRSIRPTGKVPDAAITHFEGPLVHREAAISLSPRGRRALGPVRLVEAPTRCAQSGGLSPSFPLPMSAMRPFLRGGSLPEGLTATGAIPKQALGELSPFRGPGISGSSPSSYAELPQGVHSAGSVSRQIFCPSGISTSSVDGAAIVSARPTEAPGSGQNRELEGTAIVPTRPTETSGSDQNRKCNNDSGGDCVAIGPGVAAERKEQYVKAHVLVPQLQSLVRRRNKSPSGPTELSPGVFQTQDRRTVGSDLGDTPCSSFFNAASFSSMHSEFLSGSPGKWNQDPLMKTDADKLPQESTKASALILRLAGIDSTCGPVSSIRRTFSAPRSAMRTHNYDGKPSPPAAEKHRPHVSRRTSEVDGCKAEVSRGLAASTPLPNKKIPALTAQRSAEMSLSL